MSTFPDRESTLLSKLYQSAPWTAKLHKTTGGGVSGWSHTRGELPAPVSDIGQAVGESLVSTTGEWNVISTYKYMYALRFMEVHVTFLSVYTMYVFPQKCVSNA